MSEITGWQRMARSANNCSQPRAWGKDPSNDLDSGSSGCQRCQVTDLAELYPPEAGLLSCALTRRSRFHRSFFSKTGNKNGTATVVLNECNRAYPKEEPCTPEQPLKRQMPPYRNARGIR